MLTPPDEMSASHSSAPRPKTSAISSLSSRARPRSTGTQFGLLDEGEQHLAVRLADLAGCERPAALDQLVAGRDHTDPSSRVHRHAARSRAMRARRGARAGSPSAARTPDHPLRRRSPAVRTASPGATCSLTRTVSSSAASVSSTITTASAPGGIAAPVMIRTAWPGVDLDRGRSARRQAARRPGGAPGSLATRAQCQRPAPRSRPSRCCRTAARLPARRAAPTSRIRALRSAAAPSDAAGRSS